MQTIYVVPGIGGSQLIWYFSGAAFVHVWGQNLADIGIQQLAPTFDRLVLNPDGTSKYQVFANGEINSTFYGDAIEALSKDFEVIPLGYDWRMLPSQAARSLSITKPGYFLAHSNGGLVVAHLYAQLKSKGQEALVKGIIGCGVPWGLNAAGDACEVIFGHGALVGILGFLYLTGKLYFPVPTRIKRFWAPFINALEEVIAVMQTWSGFSTLMPNVPGKWRTREAYATAPAFDSLRQDWLDRGRDENNLSLELAELLPKNLVAEILGSGFETWNVYNTSRGGGDGVVPIDAKLIDYPVFSLTNVKHNQLVNAPITSQIVKLLIDQDFPNAGLLDLAPLTGRGGFWFPQQFTRGAIEPAIPFVYDGPGKAWPDP